jgi:hypothetical protein
MMSEPVRPNYRKLAIQLIAGAVVGAVAGFALSAVMVPQLENVAGPGGFALAGVGLIYAAMGLFVGLGLLFPGLGAKVLNVADRDDLSDQRAMLVGSAVSCTVLGAALLLVALSGPQGLVPGALAVSALAFALVLLAAVTVLQWRLYDELMRGVSLEASAILAGIVFPVVALWAALAHSGQAAPLDPLGLIALLSGAMLLATFIAAGRRGLLLPQ